MNRWVATHICEHAEAREGIMFPTFSAPPYFPWARSWACGRQALTNLLVSSHHHAGVRGVCSQVSFLVGCWVLNSDLHACIVSIPIHWNIFPATTVCLIHITVYNEPILVLAHNKCLINVVWMGKQRIELNPRGTEWKWNEGCIVFTTPGSKLLKHKFTLPWSAQLGVNTAPNNLSGGHGSSPQSQQKQMQSWWSAQAMAPSWQRKEMSEMLGATWERSGPCSNSSGENWKVLKIL